MLAARQSSCIAGCVVGMRAAVACWCKLGLTQCSAGSIAGVVQCWERGKQDHGEAEPGARVVRRSAVLGMWQAWCGAGGVADVRARAGAGGVYAW